MGPQGEPSLREVLGPADAPPGELLDLADPVAKRLPMDAGLARRAARTAYNHAEITSIAAATVVYDLLTLLARRH